MWLTVARGFQPDLMGFDSWYASLTTVSWFEAKTAIMREVVLAYLAEPPYMQLSTA